MWMGLKIIRLPLKALAVTDYTANYSSSNICNTVKTKKCILKLKFYSLLLLDIGEINSSRYKFKLTPYH